jgi:FlaA1/EpsC-like NDP-sugar epimerase
MKILITGGTGSLGSCIVNRLVNETDHTIIVFSRGEQKQFQQRLKYQSNLAVADKQQRIYYVLGDVCNSNDVFKVFNLHAPDIVIHTAAQKHVRICDENPEQAVRTNILGTINVADAALQYNTVMCMVSTDKAVNPTTLYGMTKALAEKHLNNIAMHHPKLFCGVRYGNVLNSAGSLIPFFREKAKISGDTFYVTHREMTRFFISLEKAVDLICQTLTYTTGKKVFPHKTIDLFGTDGIFVIPMLKSVKIMHLAEYYAKFNNGSIKVMLPYPTEKLHEEMMTNYSSKDHVMSKKLLEKMLEEENLSI